MATEQRPPQAPTARTTPPPGLAHHTQPHDEALADYDRAIGLDPDNILAVAARGDTYLKLKQYDEALADYNRAIDLEPGYAPTLVSRGEAYKLMRRYEEALADFNRAIELNPGYARAIADRGGHLPEGAAVRRGPGRPRPRYRPRPQQGLGDRQPRGDLPGDAAVRRGPRALAEAVGEFERRNPDDDLGWFRFFDEAELSFEFGHCLRDLSRAGDATRCASRGVGGPATGRSPAATSLP